MTEREHRKFPLTRTWLVLCAVVFASCLAAASENAPSPRACPDRACPDLGSPTNFDYLVLASIADSPRFLAMAGYRSIAMQRADLAPGAELTTITTN